MGLIALEGIKIYAYHGFYKEEQIVGSYYIVDIWIDADFGDAADSDDLGGTVNYETVYRIVKAEMKKKSKLLETVGQRIMHQIRDLFSSIESIRVRISKLNPPMGGNIARAYIEMEEDYVVQCGKCGSSFLSHAAGDCWTKHGQIYPETQATLMRTYGRNMCRRCITPHLIKARR